MASNISPPGAQTPEVPSQWTSPYETAIEDRLHETRRQVKLVDLAVGLLALGTVVLAYLFVATLMDHWLIPGGLGVGGRLLLFIGLIAVTGYCFVRRLLPLLVYKINPLFAAQTIEQSRPSLKNSLINFLLLRQHREEVTRTVLDQRIYEGLEQTAAVELTQVPAATVVDRAQVIRLGYALAAVLAVCCLYLVLSPKNPLVSFSRVIWPWAEIQVPSRVTITAIEPGDTVGFQGDTLTISAEVQGLRDGETVTLYYTTADKQSVNQAIPMTVPDKGYRYQCDLPPDAAGLQQNVTYYLQAGDAHSRLFAVQVETALAILVDRVDYDYPAYTGIADASVEGTGDLRAVEGTKVTLHATANQEIDRAMLEMNCDPRNVLAMRAEAKQATGQFRLQLDPVDPLRPKYDCYQIRFRDRYGHENRRPIRHRIDVIRDQPPDVQLVDPPADKIELPVNGVLELKIRAQDPDFGLRRVVLHAERDKRSLPIGRPLLERRAPEKPHQGPFEATYRFEPTRLDLKVGDEVVYWVEARDNKEPEPNRSETSRRWITIVDPEKQSPDQPPPPDGQGPQPPPEDKQQQQPKKSDQPQQDKDAAGQPQEEQPGEKQKPDGKQPKEQGQKGQDEQPSEQQDGTSSGDQGGQSKGQGTESVGQDQAKSGEGQKGDQASGQESGQPSKPVDPDGNPGDAFDKILDYQNDKQSKPNEGTQSQPDQAKPDQAKPGEQPQGEPKSDQPQPDQGAANQQGMKGDEKQPSGDQKSGSEKSPSQPGEKSPQGGEGKQQQAGGDQKSGSEKSPSQPGEKSPQGGEGKQQQAGGDQKSGSEKSPSQPGEKSPQGGEGKQQQAGGDQKSGSEKSSSQAGKEAPPDGQPQAGGDPTGAEKKTEGPAKQPTGKPQRVPDTGQQGTQKTGETRESESDQGAQTTKPNEALDAENKGQPKTGAKGDDREKAQGQAKNHKATKSEGDATGERAGGGKEGAGQKSEQSGTGAAGSHTESEEGANQGDQPGKGTTGQQAGDQAKADRATGSQSKDKGQDTGQSKQPDGQKPGETSKDSPRPGEGGEPSADPANGPPQGTTSKGQGQPPSGASPTGGQPNNQEAPPPKPPEPEASRPDEINRKYAEKAVNLSLETLEEQLAKDQPDPELLNRLGWNRDELERFYRQWSEMRRAAGQKGPAGDAAKQQWDEALRSLGLRPGSTELRRGTGRTDDQLRNLKQSRRVAPPPGWTEQFRAYTESVAGGKQEE